MNETLVKRRRHAPLRLLLLVALLCALVVVAIPRERANASQGPAVSHGGGHGQTAAVSLNPAQAQFQDAMRKLWEDHVTWTRLAIVTFANGDGFNETAARLMQNQVDIGNAIKPYYGDEAGDQLTALLTDHIAIAVDLMTAAKAGDTAAFEAANAKWKANADDIADFLSAANPKNWPQADMRAGMQAHLDQTLREAAAELGGDYASSVAEYDVVHDHILGMADLLSTGIMKQFPKQFK